MNERDPRSALGLEIDAEVRLALRHLARAAAGSPATVEQLRATLNRPPEADPGPATLRAAPPLRALLARAGALADQRGAERIARQDLDEALAEAQALAAGLDLARLRFARWRLRTRVQIGLSDSKQGAPHA